MARSVKKKKKDTSTIFKNKNNEVVTSVESVNSKTKKVNKGSNSWFDKYYKQIDKSHSKIIKALKYSCNF